MSRGFYVILATLVCLSASAVDNDQQLRRLADRQLSAMGITAPSELMAEREACAVYGVSTGGFVVLSKQAGEDQVLGYSASTFDAGHMPCGFQWWLKAVDEALQQGATVRRAKKYNRVENFLKTTWHQDTPFNDKCPTYKDSKTRQEEHMPAGCIATSMAQVMRYYEWPAQGQGMGGYYVNDNYVEAAVDGVYDWSNMPNVPYSAGTKKSIKEAVSTLLFDCGKAVKMEYDPDGSGALTVDQALALARNFQYDSLALQYCDRAFYSSDQWMEMIDNEIQNRRPILYGGFDKKGDGGHSFVFCGIDEDGMVYVNWGWGGNGAGDGFYAVDLLDVKPYQFSEGQEMNIGIKPMSPSGSSGTYHSKWSAYYFTDPTATKTPSGWKMRIDYYYLYNAHFLPFLGDVGLYIQSTDGKDYSQLKLLETMSTDQMEYGWAYTNIDFDNNGTYKAVDISFDELPEGCYKVTLASKDSRESECQPMLADDTGTYKEPFYMAMAEDGTLTIAKEEIKEIPSSIRTQTFDETSAPVYYRIDGTKTSTPQRGITIVRQGSQVRKMIQK